MLSLQNLQYACIQTIVNTSLYIRRSPWLSPTTQPDRLKTYDGRSDLFACRVFIPQNQSSDEKLPLVINVHGGGFVVNNPSADDPLARYLADKSSCVVVSIDYRKSPQSKFPRAYEDVVELSRAIIGDKDLPVDPTRVVLLGSSGGGNLVLGAAQHYLVRPSVKGVGALYPLCDFVPPFEEKMATRPDPSIPEFFTDHGYSGIRHIYLDDKMNVPLTDIRLSPTNFASRDDLPSHVLLIGCEHDMLCHEAEVMANRLAATNDAAKVDTASGWRSAGVRWYKVKGQRHAFNHFPAKLAEDEKTRIAAQDAMYSSLSEWLMEVFSTGSGV